MTIKEALKKYSTIETDLLLSHVLGKSREFLFMEPQTKITKKQHNNLTKLIKRRKKGEPVAYILGYKDFMGLRFKVNKDVLIPRPETEILVEKVLSAKCLVKNQRVKILDVGTGSGCIIISLAKMLSGRGFEFYGSDISKKALIVARHNAKNHHVKIKFIHSKILKNLRMNFDIIIANLPYGWNEWKNNTSVETVGLKFEPKSALFTKKKGLFLIDRLLSEIAKRTSKPKYIFLEFDPRQKKDLSQLIKKYLPKADIKFYRDLHNFWRHVKIIL